MLMAKSFGVCLLAFNQCQCKHSMCKHFNDAHAEVPNCIRYGVLFQAIPLGEALEQRICACYHMLLIVGCTDMGLIRMQGLEHYKTSLPATFQ
jgi:hypothetical protein